MGQSKISLKELSSVKRKFTESINDYLNQFRLLKTRCFTQVPTHELVEMAAGRIYYSIRKKLDIQYLRDMAQLSERVRQVERLKAEKAKVSKGKKERIAYADMEDQDTCKWEEYSHVEESKVDMDELKQSPAYVCKLHTPANGKNLAEPKENDKFPKKTCTIDVTNVMIFLICWFQMDLVQNALNEGRLKFAKGKALMKIDSDPLQVVDASYVEPAVVNMV
ncbi:uncharacterized protein LOC127095602 [Lathyrus oleraceus]|uniref:uncharacterized protein LOC127095602 n=1 Tax=Pisum sativum TaxID=3888 RepID=UPI0021CEBAB7|nr:uncharacterized protein LOC127095602 [Pisum sativum]